MEFSPVVSNSHMLYIYCYLSSFLKSAHKEHFGIAVTAELQVVVKNPDLDSLNFDYYIVNGGEEFFETIVIATQSKSASETIQKEFDGTYRFLSKNYIYRNGKWHATFRKFDVIGSIKERGVDTYLLITFKTAKGMTKFLDITTHVRKAY